MKKYFVTILFILFAVVTAKAEPDVALVVLDDASLNARETAAKGMYEDYGWVVTVIDDSDASYATLNDYDLSVATENEAIAESVVDDLIENGYKVLLLYSSGQVMGGTWGSGSYSEQKLLTILSNSSFVDGYKSNLSFYVQSTGYSSYISSNPPAGWDVIGKNSRGSASTILYKNHSSGGKGVIFTYDPQSITSTGLNLYDKMHEWLTGVAPYSGKTVPTGDVAFIIRGYNDDDNPTLTDAETGLKAKLEEYGYDITYIRWSRLSESNLSNAKLVVSAEYPSIDKYTADALISDGDKVALFYSSSAVMSGEQGIDSYPGQLDLQIVSNEAFFDGYKSNVLIDVQNSLNASFIISSAPSGWTVIGKNNRDGSKPTVLFKEQGNGKGLIYGYNPKSISDEGKNIYDLIYKWFEGELPYSGKTVPNGNVAFIIMGYDDDDNPTLTDSETGLKAKLEEYGYDITYIRWSRLSESDLSNASLVVATQYPTLDKYTIEDIIQDGGNVALFYAASSSLGMEMGFDSYSGQRVLITISNEEFLNGYKSSIGTYAQSSGTAAFISSGTPSGWTNIGLNNRDGNKPSVYYKKHISGGKGLIYTYNPYSISNVGSNILDRIYKWFEDTAPYAGKTVPNGNVAFVIYGYDDDDDPDLSGAESGLKSKLEDKGYDITYIRSARLPESDLSNAAFVVAAEYPSIDKNTIEDLLADGKNVSLYHCAASVLGGSWDYLGYTGNRELKVVSNSEFLSDYEIDDVITVQSSGYAWYIDDNPPSNWSILGRNTRSNDPNVLSYNNIGKGLIYTYNPEFFSTDGDLVFDDIEVWSETENDDLGKPDLYNPNHNSTEVVTSPVFSWDDVDDATEYQIQISTNAIFTSIVVDEDVSDTEYVDASLSTSTDYFWRVRAKNTSETGIWSEVSEFTSSSVSGSGDCNNNLVMNPGCEMPLVDGEIPYWDEVIGNNWIGRSNNGTHTGDYYFYANNTSYAELEQFVDVSQDSTDIDNQSINYLFSSWHRSYSQNPIDESKVILEFWNSDKSTRLDTIDLGFQHSLYWKKVSELLLLPVNTRWVNIRLIADRNTGTSNDGYIDDVFLGITDESYKPVEIQLYMDGLWDGTEHKPTSVAIELRSGSSLINSSLDLRIPCVIQSDGTATLNFGSLPDGDYWLVVRSAGYLPLGSTSEISLSSVQATYDFTDAESKSAGGARAVIEDDGDFLMRGGDLNYDRKTNASDAFKFINNNGKSVSSYVPAP